MILKTFNFTLGVLVAFSVWCFAIAYGYVLVEAVLLALHLTH